MWINDESFESDANLLGDLRGNHFDEGYTLFDVEINIDPAIKKILQSVAVAKRTNESMLISYRAEVSVADLYREVWQRANTKAAFQIRYLNTIDKIISEG